MKGHFWRHIRYETWDYFVRKVAVLIGWFYFCRVWIIRLFRPTGVTWIFCGFGGYCSQCCVLPLRNLLDSLDGRVARLVTASCSKPVAEGDIIATAYVTKTVIAADWICLVSCKDTYGTLQPASCFTVLLGVIAGFGWAYWPMSVSPIREGTQAV